MKAFSFPLARVLDLRHKQVQIEELKLEGMLVECRRLKLEIERLRSEASGSAQALLSQRILLAVELQALSFFRTWTEQQCAVLGEQLLNWEKLASEQRVRLNHVRQEERLVEKLRERRRAEWEVGWHRELEEQALESFLSRWNRERALLGRETVKAV